MPRGRLSMRKVEDVLRLRWGAGLSPRQIAKSVGIGRTTVSEYIARAEAAGITWPLPEGMNAAELERRLQAGDVHPSGPLCGRGEPPVTGACRQLEDDCLAPFDDWVHGLGAARMQQERRSLRVMPRDMAWSWPAGDELLLEFMLPAGSFATAVLRELVQCGE